MKISELVSMLDSPEMLLIRDAEVRGTELCTNIRFDDAITFLGNPKFLSNLSIARPLSVICTKETKDLLPENITGVLVATDPKYTFFCIHNLLYNQLREKKKTVIGENCLIEDGVIISPFNVVIGDNVSIESGAIIRENVTIGDGCVIGAGTVVGGRSFSSTRHNGRTVNLTDCGGVVLGRGVKICSNCHIACGTLTEDKTVLDDYCQLDAMVHVGHGTYIGKEAFITAGVMLSGNTIVGDRVWLGVNATISNRLEIGNDARITLGSVVTKDVLTGQTVTGNFAIEHQQFMRNLKKSIQENE